MRDYEPDNLVMDCRRAMELGYGVHYGHYKADHPHTRDTSLDPEPEHKYPERECKNCGEPFWPHRGDQIYCCEECRNERNRKSETKRPDLARQTHCKRCGAEIVAPKFRVYCSWECQEAAYKKRGKRQAGAESCK